jgi:hypothetical protein
MELISGQEFLRNLEDEKETRFFGFSNRLGLSSKGSNLRNGKAVTD